MADSKIMRTISALLSIVLASSFAVVPASARESGGVRGGFWDVIYSYSGDSDYGKAVLRGLGKLTGEGACSSSETGHHVGSPYHVRRPGARGAYSADCRCDVCGSEFSVVLNADELAAAYDAYVQELPAQGYTSEGTLIWTPRLSDCRDSTFTVEYPLGHTFLTIPADASVSEHYRKIDEHSAVIYGSANSPDSLHSIGWTSGGISWNLPIDCLCKRLSSPYFDLSYVKPTGVEYSAPTCFYGEDTDYRDVTVVLENNAVYVNSWLGATTVGRCSSFSYTLYTPQYSLIPKTDLSGDTYNVNSRPASISGDYGIIGDDGKIVKVEGNTIINATNNMYFNPATGQSFPITDWSYDYPSRSYNLTLDSGDTATVTYGDENLTIMEGDTVYNVYYLTEGTGETPADCTHEWSKTGTTSAACTVPGSITYTCSLCSQTKTETVPASGHTWQVKQTVTTQYDETGNLVTQGYTLYECSVCHEQYKDDGGAGPPSSPGSDDPGKPSTIGGLIEKLLSGVGGVLGGLIKGVLSLLTKAVEALAEIGTLFTQFTETVVSIFGGFTSFLSAVFPFLPEEFFTIFTLGMLLLVAAAVLKKFLS